MYSRNSIALLSVNPLNGGTLYLKTFPCLRLLTGSLLSFCFPSSVKSVINHRSKMFSSNGVKQQDKNENYDKILKQNGLDSAKRYAECIKDLNLLQSNTQAIALAKYKVPKDILPLFEKQLNLAGIQVDDLDKLNVVHISGTKGKGSTCAFLESILREEGLKTGFYNSPHLVKVTERIKIDGRPIDEEKFSLYFRKVYGRLQSETKSANISMPSYFSFLTILAFHIFLEEKVDCSVVEVGIGGEYDPTNIVRQPVACGITTLDYDHTNILGKTIADIAWSKAGIAKKGVSLFTIEHEQKQALDVIKSRCDERLSPLYIVKPLDEQNLKLGIKGSIQYTNAALACQLAKHFLVGRKENPTKNQLKVEPLKIDLNLMPPSFRRALTNCSWPGRCQILKYPNKTIFLDGAHTMKSMENCLRWFLDESKADDEEAAQILLVNVIGERNKYNVLRPLAHYGGFDAVIFSTNRINSAGDTPKSQTFLNVLGPNSEKSMENVQRNVETWKLLQKEVGKEGVLIIKSNTYDSMNYIDMMINNNSSRNHHILVTGSLHFVGAILETLSAGDL